MNEFLDEGPMADYSPSSKLKTKDVGGTRVIEIVHQDHACGPLKISILDSYPSL